MSHHHIPMTRDRRTEVPNFGLIHGQTVGNTSHTTGIDFSYIAYGEAEPVVGSVRFAAFVGDDGSIEWKFVHATGPLARKRSYRDEALTEQTQLDYPPQVVAAMRAAAQAMHLEPSNSWFFSALGAVQMELEQREGKQQELERAVENFTKFLSNPAEPRQTFVSAKDAGADKGHHRPATAEETAERRAMWNRNLERDTQSLADLHVEQDDRLAMLRRVRAALREWSWHKGPKPQPSAHETYMAALAA